MSKSMKERLTKQVTDNLGLMSPDKSNSGKLLWPIFYWQVISEVADKAFKEAWDTAANAEIFDEDDKLRELETGEHLLADSDSFSALISVSKPRMNFDRDQFIEAIAKKFKIPVAKLEALAETCKTKGAASLTKRIVEASK